MRNLLFFLFLVSTCSFGQAVHQAQYGVGATFDFVLFNADGTLDVDEVDGGTEVAISCNEGAETTATNDFVDEGNFYSIAVTAAELTCARATVVISATDTNVFIVETFGDLNAQILGRGNASGVAQSATSNTIVLASATNIANDFLNEHIIEITGGTGAGQTRLITDWVQSTDTATVSDAWITNPDSTSEYIVHSVHQGLVTADVNGVVEGNLVQVSDDATAAANLEAMLDGTGGVTLSADNLTDVFGYGLGELAADSGSSFSLTDAALTQASSNWFVSGTAIVFTSAALQGQIACVDSFTPATDTITFSPRTTADVATDTYYLIAAPGCVRGR